MRFSLGGTVKRKSRLARILLVLALSPLPASPFFAAGAAEPPPGREGRIRAYARTLRAHLASDPYPLIDLEVSLAQWRSAAQLVEGMNRAGGRTRRDHRPRRRRHPEGGEAPSPSADPPHRLGRTGNMGAGRRAPSLQRQAAARPGRVRNRPHRVAAGALSFRQNRNGAGAQGAAGAHAPGDVHARPPLDSDGAPRRGPGPAGAAAEVGARSAGHLDAGGQDTEPGRPARLWARPLPGVEPPARQPVFHADPGPTPRHVLSRHAEKKTTCSTRAGHSPPNGGRCWKRGCGTSWSEAPSPGRRPPHTRGERACFGKESSGKSVRQPESASPTGTHGVC